MSTDDTGNANNGINKKPIDNLRKQYYDSSSSQNFASSQRLKQAFPELTYGEIANWLMGQRVHTQFIQPKKFQRRTIIRKDVYNTISVDLADYQKYRNYNYANSNKTDFRVMSNR